MQDYFESIIVPIDFEENTSLVIKQAYILGQLMNSDVVLIHVYDKAKETFSKLEKAERLKYLAQTAEEKYGLKFYPLLTEGHVANSIVQFAKENYAKIIIMGVAKNSSFLTINKESDSIAPRIIREADCPVLTICEKIIYDIDKILLPLDLTKSVEQKLNWAIYFAGFFGCILKVVSISDSNNSKRNIELENKIQKVKAMLNESNVFCTIEILDNQPRVVSISQRIVEYSKTSDCDLILVMTKEENMNKIVNVGRTASNIIALSNKPVITITPNTI